MLPLIKITKTNLTIEILHNLYIAESLVAKGLTSQKIRKENGLISTISPYKDVWIATIRKTK